MATTAKEEPYLSLSYRRASEQRLELELLGLKSARNATHLDLMDAALSDEVLEFVGSLPHLVRLNLGCSLQNKNPQITDERLRFLSGLTKLETLTLHGNPITDEGLNHLASLPRLESLQLGGTEVCGEGLIHVPHLKWLRLDATPITDEALEAVSRMRNLEQLYLYGCDISDAGLAHLHDLKHLRLISLHSTQVMAEGIDALKQALPDSTIDWDGDLNRGNAGFHLDETVLLDGNATLQDCFINLDTGQVMSLPAELVEALKRDGQLNGGFPQVGMVSEWAEESGADLILRSTDEGSRLVTLVLLGGRSIESDRPLESWSAPEIRVSAEKFAEIDFGKQAHDPNLHMSVAIRPASETNRSFLFVTREGGMGVIQASEGEDGPRSVRVRFKLIER